MSFEFGSFSQLRFGQGPNPSRPNPTENIVARSHQNWFPNCKCSKLFICLYNEMYEKVFTWNNFKSLKKNWMYPPLYPGCHVIINIINKKTQSFNVNKKDQNALFNLNIAISQCALIKHWINELSFKNVNIKKYIYI